MLFSYPVDLTTDEGGRVVARVPDVKGCVTDGASRAEALIEASDALGTALAAAMLGGEDIPAPSAPAGRPVVSAGALVSAKIALRLAMRDAKVSNVELGNRMDLAETEIRRMLDFKHATKITRLEQALAVLGRQMIISVEAA